MIPRRDRDGDDARAEIRALSVRYAAAMDERDPARIPTTFAEGARLEVIPPGASAPHLWVEGLDALGEVPGRLARYDLTAHLLGQIDVTVAPGGDRATGTVWCTAHHVTRTPEGGTDHVMHIRYEDDYVRSEAGRWRIAVRRVRIRWTETREIDPLPGPARRHHGDEGTVAP